MDKVNIDKENKNEFKGKYFSAIGRRKTAVAQVRLYKNGKGIIIINGKNFSEYFSETKHYEAIPQPLKLTGLEKKVDCSILIKGGGKEGQAEAARHGMARVLLDIDKELKPVLKKEGLLTRDPRKKERKKPGLKKARRAGQWSKR